MTLNEDGQAVVHRSRLPKIKDGKERSRCGECRHCGILELSDSKPGADAVCMKAGSGHVYIASWNIAPDKCFELWPERVPLTPEEEAREKEIIKTYMEERRK